VANLAQVGLADDVTPAANGDRHLSPTGGSLKVIAPREVRRSDNDDFLIVEAEARVGDLVPLTAVGRLGTVHKETGELMLFDSLEGRLVLAGFDRCQVAVALRMAGHSGVRTEFVA